MTTTTERVLNVREVAEILRVKPNTVYGIVERGELKATRVGRLVRITQTALDEYLGERR